MTPLEEKGAVKPGDDLSYYLGPGARRATAEQCAELERAFREAAETVSRTSFGEPPARHKPSPDEPNGY